MSAQDAARPGPALATPRLLRLYPVLGNAAFRLFWLGMLPTTVSWQLSVVAAPYAAFTLTNSATILGLVSLAGGLPVLLLSLVGGVVADRLPRRNVLIVVQSILGLAAAGVAVLALGGGLQVWHLLAFGVAQGTAFAFNMPARQAYLADLIPRPLLQNAVALNNAGLNFCRVAGPALAGAALAAPAIGVGGVFLTMLVMHGLVIATLLRLPNRPLDKGPAPSGQARPPRPSSWAQLIEGLTYIRSSPALLALLGMAALVVFLGMPFQTLLPLFAERVFGVGAAGLGALTTATGLGALGGSLAVAVLANAARPARLQLGFGIGFGLALVGFALAPSFPLALLALVLVGFMSSAYTALNSTLVIAAAEPRFYGRVMSVYLLTFATMPLGALPLAWLADQLGGRPTILGSGLAVVAVLAAVVVLYRPDRRIELRRA